MTMQNKRKRTISPNNSTAMWRVHIFVVDELRKEAIERGFQNIANLVNVLLASYFNDEVLQRPDVDINAIDLSSMATIQTSWRIRTRSYNNLRHDAKAFDMYMSALANNILMRYVLGQKVQRGQ